MKKPGAKAVVCYGGKFLLVLRDNDPSIAYPNKWNLPGGGLGDNEKPEDAIVRELGEEINLTNPNLIYTGTTTYTDGSVVYRFFCDLTNEQFKNIKLLHEGQRLDWFTVDEALGLIEKNEYSPYLASYLKNFAKSIGLFLDGKYNISPTDTVLSIG